MKRNITRLLFYLRFYLNIFFSKKSIFSQMKEKKKTKQTIELESLSDYKDDIKFTPMLINERKKKKLENNIYIEFSAIDSS